jgi:glycosyltransferase involved in cell wall biosynthesis
MKSEGFTRVSVIIPVYRDWRSLEICLKMLKMQSYPSRLFEIVVINNDPKDTPPYTIDEGNSKLLIEGKKGSYSARNKGILESTGDIILFTDSDCIPNYNWIQGMVSGIENGHDRIAGNIELNYRSDKLSWPEIYEKSLAFKQEDKAKRGVSVTANMACKRELFDKVGLFNDNLLSGGDIEWSNRASSKGFDIFFCKKSTVKHPARYNLSQLFSKRKRVIGGTFTSINNDKHQPVLMLFFQQLVPPINIFKKLKNRTHLTILEKMITFFVHYIIKLYSSYCIFLFKVNIDKPTR